jgi:hypothetical protein
MYEKGGGGLIGVWLRKENNKPRVELKGFWQWYITFGITCFLEFVQKLENKFSETGSSSDLGYPFLRDPTE